MLSCKQASHLLSQSLDRRLTLRERIALRFHLAICDFCRRFSQQLQQLIANIRLQREQIEQDAAIQLPPDARKRISNVLDSR